MIGMEEGLLPHRRSLAPRPRRSMRSGGSLCRHYARQTPAYADSPAEPQKWGKDRPTIPGRFLYEVTGQADNPSYANTVRLASQLDKLADPRAAISAHPTAGKRSKKRRSPPRQ